MSMMQKNEWYVLGKSVKGASHSKSGLPNQDFIGWQPKLGKDLPLVLSIADGHGSEKYFRSHFGAQFAVEIANALVYRFAIEHAQQPFSTIASDVQNLPAQIVSQWRKKVKEDWNKKHTENSYWTLDEQEWIMQAENAEAWKTITANPTIPYGATILTVLVTEHYLLYLQLGDGDILTVASNGDIDEPVSPDARNLANETTSLCNTTAARDFRIKFHRRDDKKPALIMLSTDGYSNSFRKRAGFHKVGSDIWNMIHTNKYDGLKTVEDSLANWLTHATQTGSGDDITVGLLCRLNALDEDDARPKMIPHIRDDRDRDQLENIPTQNGEVIVPPEMPAVQPIDIENLQTRIQVDVLTTPTVNMAKQKNALLPPQQLPEKSGQGQSALSPVMQMPRRPRVLVVSQYKREGQYFTSIGEALRDANPGDQIVVYPGKYHEKTLVLDKEVEIIGEGLQKDIMIEGGSPCIQMRTDVATLRRLTIQGKPKLTSMKDEDKTAIDIAQGCLNLLDCTITSKSGICVYVHGLTATPSIFNCTIVASEKGLVFSNQATGSVKDSNIYQQREIGVEIKYGSNPLLQNCKIYGEQEEGVRSWKGGQGKIEDCDIYGALKYGIRIIEHGQPTIQGCRTYSCRKAGILVDNQGRGTVKNSSIERNTGPGIIIMSNGTSIITECEISQGQDRGVYIFENGQGTITHCKVQGNCGSGIEIRQRGHGTIEQCEITDGKYRGISILDNGSAAINECKIFNSANSGIAIDGCDQVAIKNCVIEGGHSRGILFTRQSIGRVENTHILNNEKSGIEVSQGSKSLVVNCTIKGSGYFPIYAHDEGHLIVENCDLRENTKQMYCEEGSWIDHQGENKQ